VINLVDCINPRMPNCITASESCYFESKALLQWGKKNPDFIYFILSSLVLSLGHTSPLPIRHSSTKLISTARRIIAHRVRRHVGRSVLAAERPRQHGPFGQLNFCHDRWTSFTLRYEQSFKAIYACYLRTITHPTGSCMLTS
jgi:hypothetical protein